MDIISKIAGFYDKPGPLYTAYKANKKPADYGSSVKRDSGADGYSGTNDVRSWQQLADKASYLDYAHEKARAERIREFTKQQVLNDYNNAPGWFDRKWHGFKEFMSDTFVPDRWRTAYRYEGSPEYAEFKRNLTKSKARKVSAAGKSADAEYLANKNYEFAMSRARAIREQKYNQVMHDKQNPKPSKGWFRQYIEDIKNFYS